MSDRSTIVSTILSRQRRVHGLVLFVSILAFGLLTAASDDVQSPVSSYLEGRITVSAEIDSSQDYSGFQVFVGAADERGDLDTLAMAVTDRAGEFSMDIEAPDRGVYSLLIVRGGDVLTIGDIVVSEGDSARLSVEFPLSSNWLPLRSRENASWLAYNNTRIQHSRQLAQMFDGQETVAGDSLAAHFQQTSNILWNLHTSYPNTIGAEFAGAESVILLEGWNDSLTVRRANQLTPENRRYAAVGRAARRAIARLEGQHAALELLDQYKQQAPDDAVRAELQAEVVRARLDSLEKDQAVAAAQQLKQEFPDTPWAEWAERAEYEASNLMPGMPAPSFITSTVTGESFSLENLKGNVVILEFWAPQSSHYRRQLPQINQLVEQIESDTVQWVGVNLDSNRELFRAFEEGRTLPGIQVQPTAEEAESLVERYNVSSLPTRFIIDADGNIVGKYIGSIASIRADLFRYLNVSSESN